AIVGRAGIARLRLIKDGGGLQRPRRGEPETAHRSTITAQATRHEEIASGLAFEAAAAARRACPMRVWSVRHLPAFAAAASPQGFAGQASQAVAPCGSPHRSTLTGVPWCVRRAASPRR